MANVIAANPLVIDTADDNIFRKAHPVMVKRVVWKMPETAGDKLVIKDQNGSLIVDAVCEIADQSQVFLIEHSFDGLLVHTIDSGTAYIFLN